MRYQEFKLRLLFLRISGQGTPESEPSMQVDRTIVFFNRLYFISYTLIPGIDFFFNLFLLRQRQSGRTLAAWIYRLDLSQCVASICGIKSLIELPPRLLFILSKVSATELLTSYSGPYKRQYSQWSTGNSVPVDENSCVGRLLPKAYGHFAW